MAPSFQPHRFLGQALRCVLLALLLWSPADPGVFGEETSNRSPEQLLLEGAEFFREGHLEDAVSSWDRAAGLFEAAGQRRQQIEALLQLAHGLQSLGFHDETRTTLEFALNVAKQLGASHLTAAVLGRLGAAHLAAGQPHLAHEALQKALTVARKAPQPLLLGTLLNDWGNVLVVQDRPSDALGAYTESIILAEAAGHTLLAVHGLINSALVSIKLEHYEDSRDRLVRAWESVQSVPPSHDSVFAMLGIALAMSRLAPHLSNEQPPLLARAGEVLTASVEGARSLHDARAESYAWGYLGHLYEKEQRLEESLELTRRAIRVGQQGNMPESLYRWEWQTGRIFRAMGRQQEAIQAYGRAIATLQPIRRHVTRGPLGEASTFRESIGVLFLELADLLLQESDAAKDEELRSKYLYQVRDTMESFKAAELQDYFRDDCVQAVQARTTGLEGLSRTTAVIYPIIFPTRLELLVSAGNRIQRVSVPKSSRALIQEIHAFRSLLEKRTTHQYLPYAQALYDVLIRPLDPLLKAMRIDTLVFVPDGALRTIPMGPLHDGTHFLIERFAIAMTPGLTLTDPQPLNRKDLRLLSAGLTQGVQGFPPLPNVEKEVKALQVLYGGQVLLDQRFKVTSLEKILRDQPFTIVHIASHGKFEANAHQSFLLAFDEKLTMDRLDQLIGLFQFRDTPLDLLTLSACETAAGDDRAALGLAGVAIKAGARSALATLWFINDKASSDLVEAFYKELSNPLISKAQALQHAQLQLLSHRSYRHPGYWAPFLLINNWL